MIFRDTKIAGVFEILPELREDERGRFFRVFCEDELSKHGVNFRVRQMNRSFNKTRGTLRGFHFQKHPKWEAKIMSSLSGSFFVAVADLRPTSATYREWVSFELSAHKANAVHVPVGCANAFLTLEDNSEALYVMSEFYSPEHAGGFNWADKDVGVVWPFVPRIMSPKDAALPPLAEAAL